MQSVHELLQRNSTTNPEQLAVIGVDGTSVNWRQLYEQVQALASQLRANGVQKPDRVALVMPDGPELVMTFLAVSSSCTCAPLNTKYKEKDFAFYLDDLQARAVIIPQGFETEAKAVAGERNIPVWEMRATRTDGTLQLSLEGSVEASNRGTDVDWAGAKDVGMILHTSGTTSRPKMVPLTHENLLASAANVSNTLQLSQEDTGLVIMPLFHIHGLIGAMLSAVHSVSRIVCTPGFDESKFLDWAVDNKITWYSAVPTMHQAILDRCRKEPESAGKINLRLVRSSSASLPPKVFEDLATLWNAPVIESYGMTEAAHQMTSNPMTPKVQKPGSVGPMAGPEVSVIGEDGKALPTGKAGPIWIKGPNVTPGYLNNPEANAEAFKDGWFQTGDEGYFDEDGYLFLTGRLKEMINRGGENIAPREIDEALLEHPAVAQATAFAVPHESLSEDVAAAVILKPEADVDEAELRSYLAGKLADFKVPTRIVFVDTIPKGPTGKLQRIGLHEKLADILEVAFEAPVSESEKLVVGLMEELLERDKIGVNDNFFFMGGDSIRATRLLNRLKEHYPMELPLTLVFSKPTAKELAAYLGQREEDPDLESLVEELSKLSPEEVERLLGEQGGGDTAD